LSNLGLELCPLLHEVTSMAREQLELQVTVAPSRLQESEAVDGCAEDALQIIVIGLGVGVSRLPIMPGCKGMHQSCFTSCAPKGALHGAMVGPGHLDGDDVVFQAVTFACLTDLRRCQCEGCSLVLDDRGLDEHAPVEIAEHPFGTGFCAIDGDDAEVLWTDGLHTRLDNARRFAEDGWTFCTDFAGLTLCSHSNSLLSWVKRLPLFPTTNSWNDFIDFF
jgi:hypothetical protein